MRLMIVDDEPLVRIGIRTILEARSPYYEIAGEAGDGRSAVAMALELKPDLILVDVKMPIMNGLEFIERVKPFLPRTRYIILSCINEFDSVRGAMRLGVTDYIVKTTLDSEELIAIIEKVRSDLLVESRHAAGDYERPQAAQGQDDSKAALLALASGEALAEGSLRALLLRLAPEGAGLFRTAAVSLELRNSGGPAPRPLSLASAVNICQEVIGRSTPSICAARGGDGILILMHEPGTDSLREIFRSLLRSLEEYLDATASIGVGPVLAGESADGFRSSYAAAEAALRLAFYTGAGAVHGLDLPGTVRPALVGGPLGGSEKAAQARVHARGRDPEALVAELARCVCSGDVEALNLALEQALHESVEARSEKINEVKSAFTRLMFGVIERVEVSCGAAAYTMPEDYVAEFMAAKTVFDLVEKVAELCSSLSSIIRTDCEGGGSRIVSSIREYVMRNIGSDINLASVGEQLKMSPSYISRLFKLKTGGGFGDYVIGEKMKLARTLIAQGEKLSSIAERTGYSDEAALSRAFKHSEGLSPSEFRKLSARP